ncbi:hypothetical protein BKA81DRAFT_343603, partial [Phyllosticta paracitricarpa]
HPPHHTAFLPLSLSAASQPRTARLRFCGDGPADKSLQFPSASGRQPTRGVSAPPFPLLCGEHRRLESSAQSTYEDALQIADADEMGCGEASEAGKQAAGTVRYGGCSTRPNASDTAPRMGGMMLLRHGINGS